MKKSVKIKLFVPGLINFCVLELRERKGRKRWKLLKGKRLHSFRLKRVKKGFWSQKIQEGGTLYEVSIHIGNDETIKLKNVPVSFLF